MFIERTNNGELARRLRKAEEEMKDTLGDCVKIVEKAGTQVKSLLWKPDPWNGTGCHKKDCPVCEEEEEKVLCTKKNLVYTSTCILCKMKGKKSIYVGETSRSLGERSQEHWTDYKKEDKEWRNEEEIGHMKIPQRKENPAEKARMILKVRKVCQTALERKVRESVL